MRILHVVHTPRFSGAEILVSGLTAMHSEMGHDSQVVSFKPPEDNFLPVIGQQSLLGVEWISPAKSLSKLRRLLFIAKVKSKFKPDVIFAHSVIPAVYARLIAPVNVISVLHAENNYESKYFSTTEHILQWFTLGIISVSETARLKYKAVFSHPITTNIPNGIDVKKFIMNFIVRTKMRCELGLAKDGFMILQVGRVDRIKQQHISLLAAIPIIKSNPKVHLYFLGLIEDSAYIKEMQVVIKSAGVESNIHFLGARNDVANLLCAADLFLMPSLMESQGIALIEALASGISVLASNIENFQFAKAFAGVMLLPSHEVDCASMHIENAVLNPERHIRDLSHMNIERTAAAYINFAASCLLRSTID